MRYSSQRVAYPYFVVALLLFGLQVAFVHPDAVHGVLTEVVSVD